MQGTSNSTSPKLAQLRLFQLISPGLPIGGFTYSQGLEWAVEAQWVTSQKSLALWLGDILQHSLATLEIPLLMRLYRAVELKDLQKISELNQFLVASRETSELRAEESQRGQALARLLKQLLPELDQNLLKVCAENQLAGIALAANYWHIELEQLCLGYLWSWLENTSVAGVKLIPLGQSAGQQILMELSSQFEAALDRASSISDEQMGSFTPAQIIASCRHQTQYTRLFRS
ncbi:urease accessory protein UreF [Alginatibacterium sediminis]|uniref:Urease accessory protein UreF n=1 Tax=Alginatibacterium sediminis TaxID=2164068 RepID=A0A420E5J8_9ALTE|nr:urease accessory protein UreF [Alginatibacterium sediminis]RKF12788.1 urease accessory protein UreF [Alginatibacterium sediminis]